MYGEEASVSHGPEEDDGHERHVAAQYDSRGEDLFELPAIGEGGRFDSVLGDRHDSS